MNQSIRSKIALTSLLALCLPLASQAAPDIAGIVSALMARTISRGVRLPEELRRAANAKFFARIAPAEREGFEQSVFVGENARGESLVVGAGDIRTGAVRRAGQAMSGPLPAVETQGSIIFRVGKVYPKEQIENIPEGAEFIQGLTALNAEVADDFLGLVMRELDDAGFIAGPSEELMRAAAPLAQNAQRNPVMIVSPQGTNALQTIDGNYLVEAVFTLNPPYVDAALVERILGRFVHGDWAPAVGSAVH